MDGIDTFETDGCRVTCLTDGGKTFAAEVFPGVSADLQSDRTKAVGLTGVATAFNAYLIAMSDGTITLVDTGCGTLFGQAGGQFATLLARCGVAPDDVDQIIFTHLHGDHCGGAMSDGALVFPRAKVIMHKDEAAHWTGQATAGGALLAACADNLQLVDTDDFINDMIQIWALPGHTPGHVGLRIGKGLVLVGDVVHSEALQLPDPSARTIYDVDGDMAERSRVLALRHVAQNDRIWSGSHMLGPDKFARLATDGAGFRRIAR